MEKLKDKMKNKIPPPIVALVCGLAIYFASTVFASILFPYSSLIGSGFLVFGFGVIIVAVSSFRKYQTTINPLEPKTASTLVTDGIFRFSRNPMSKLPHSNVLPLFPSDLLLKIQNVFSQKLEIYIRQLFG